MAPTVVASAQGVGDWAPPPALTWVQRAWDQAPAVVCKDADEDGPSTLDDGDEEYGVASSAARPGKKRKFKQKTPKGFLGSRFMRRLAPMPDGSSPKLLDIINMVSTLPPQGPLYVEEEQIQRLSGSDERTTLGLQITLPSFLPSGNVNIYFRSWRCVV